MATGIHTGLVSDMLDEDLGFAAYVLRNAISFRGRPASDFAYHEAIAQAEAKLADWDAKTDEERLEFARSVIAEKVAGAEASLAEERRQQTKLQAMLREVKEWQTPSPAYEPLKLTMIEEIEGSLQYISPEDIARRLDSIWREQDPHRLVKEHHQNLLDEIEHYQERAEAEERRSAAWEAWMGPLRASLPKAEVAAK